MTAAVARELWRRYVLTLHVLVYAEAACPISGCAHCARLRVRETLA